MDDDDDTSASEIDLSEMTPEELEDVASFIYNELLDVVVQGQISEFHRAIKQGYFHLDEVDDENEGQQDLENQDESSIVCFVSSTKRLECTCPCCDRSVSAERFAAHLSGCMGFGRLSSRLANARIASVTKEENRDDDDDSDWDEKSDRKSSKKKKDKGGRGGRGSRKKKGASGAKEK